MNTFAVFLIVSFVSKCWGSPASYPAQPGVPTQEELNEILDATDSQIDEAIRSIDMANNILSKNPAYLNLEKALNNRAAQNSFDERPAEDEETELSSEIKHPAEKTGPGIELEFDTTKLIVKNKDNVIKSHKEKRFYPTVLKNLPEQDIKPNRFVPPQQMQQQQEQTYLAQQQFIQQQRKRQQINSLEGSMIPKNCDLNCEDAGNPVCGVNSNNRYSIFENMCEMEVSNCIDPELDWQTLPREIFMDNI